MAKRRSTRGEKKPTEESAATESIVAEEPTEEEKCPACSDSSPVLAAGEVELWIRCETCRDWFHWRCSGDGTDLDTIDKWHCKKCSEGNPKRIITRKPPARKSSRKRAQQDYAHLEEGVGTDPARFLRMMEGKPVKDANFKHMLGADVGEHWLEEDETALSEPIIIDSTDGLGITMPPPEFGVEDVAEILDSETPVEVIDVASQSNSPGWTIASWADYYALAPEAREKVLNVISLEISGTPIANLVLPPRIFRELDWVEKFWPNTRKGKGHTYPKVQLYCLMGVAGAWTDWHIDFAGSSVYYHIHTGSKVFYFIRPTAANLAAYERWSGTELQNHRWLGDLCDEVFKVTLHQGNTMIIPTGWIHAVYTPVDTLVFGGNFLHTYNMATQLRVREIEINTQVPKKFRFPQFSKLCWYVGDKYLRDIKNKEEFSPRLLEGIEHLAEFLVSESRLIDKPTTPELVKKEAKDQVPTDRIKDPAAMSRELRWRIKAAAGRGSDDEGYGGAGKKINGLNGNKRKRDDSVVTTGSGNGVRFKNFRPKLWDQIREEPIETEIKEAAKVKRPSGYIHGWEEWKQEVGEETVNVNTRRDVIVKMRRTERGVERQRVERVLEVWEWDGDVVETGDGRVPPTLALPTSKVGSPPLTEVLDTPIDIEAILAPAEESPPAPAASEDLAPAPIEAAPAASQSPPPTDSDVLAEIPVPESTAPMLVDADVVPVAPSGPLDVPSPPMEDEVPITIDAEVNSAKEDQLSVGAPPEAQLILDQTMADGTLAKSVSAET